MARPNRVKPASCSVSGLAVGAVAGKAIGWTRHSTRSAVGTESRRRGSRLEHTRRTALKLSVLARTRGVAAALLMLVASFATNTLSAVASRARAQDPAIQAAPVVHALVAHRVVHEERSQRRLPAAVDLPFGENASGAIAQGGASARPASVEHTVVARPVPRAYDATAPPRS